VGAKDWMIVYADGDVRPVLRKAPEPDRDATRALVARLYPDHEITPLDDGNLNHNANPREGEVYAGCFDGLTIVCTDDAALDAPSQVDPRFLALGRTTYLHAMHSVVDWGAFAEWAPDGTLRRALSLSPDSGIVENTGTPYEFEAPYWAGERPVGDGYPLPFHPLDLAEAALRAFFGFTYEGVRLDDDPELADVVLLGFAVA
jgi:hypothetical protein